MNKNASYAGSRIILTTKHSKSIVVAPPFLSKLSVEVTECVIDTDMLGTFSGEIEREGGPLECARRKCQLGMNITGSRYGLSSEGSFGPHPIIPFAPYNNEILYFIDLERDFHLHLSYFSEKTNFNSDTIDSIEELKIFAKRSLFPSHALIVRPNSLKNKDTIFKGINTQDALEQAFNESIKYSSDGKVWVETDMRAHMNPSRMAVIKTLAEALSKRLSKLCSKCNNPGWGKVRVEKGLECSGCGLNTALTKSEIFGCIKCGHEIKLPASPGIIKADPGNCSHCNP